MKNFKKVRLNDLNYPNTILGYFVFRVLKTTLRYFVKKCDYGLQTTLNIYFNYPRVLISTKYPNYTPPYIYRGC